MFGNVFSNVELHRNKKKYFIVEWKCAFSFGLDKTQICFNNTLLH